MINLTQKPVRFSVAQLNPLEYCFKNGTGQCDAMFDLNVSFTQNVKDYSELV